MAYIAHSDTQQTAHSIHSQNLTHMVHSLICSRWHILSTHWRTANGTHDRWHTSQGNHACHVMWKTHLWKLPWNSTYRNRAWCISVCLKQMEQMRTLGKCFSFWCKNVLKAEKFVVPLEWEILWSGKQILKVNIYVNCVGRLWYWIILTSWKKS